MIEHTHDSPAEREEKAEFLRIEREELARIIAAQTKKFRWEVRAYWFGVIGLIYFNT